MKYCSRLSSSSSSMKSTEAPTMTSISPTASVRVLRFRLSCLIRRRTSLIKFSGDRFSTAWLSCDRDRSIFGKCIPRYTFLRNERALRGKKIARLGNDLSPQTNWTCNLLPKALATFFKVAMEGLALPFSSLLISG